MLDYQAILITALLNVTLNTDYSHGPLCVAHNNEFVYCHPAWVNVVPSKAEYKTLLEAHAYRNRWPSYEIFREGQEWDEFTMRVINKLTRHRDYDDRMREEYVTISKEQANKAAQWWADTLTSDADNMDAYEGVPGASGFLKMSQQIMRKNNPTRVERFRDILVERLQKQLASPRGYSLEVDYHPIGLL